MVIQKFRKAKEASGLQVGEVVKNFTAKDLHGESFELTKTLQKGSLVLIFYRGHWCPVCNKHLKKLEASLDKIYAKGAQVVAISPEKSEFLKLTADKTKASFRLLFDEDYTISKIFDVYFKPSTIHRLMYNTMLGAKLKEAHSDDSEQLPIPATFIIDKDAKVVWRHFNPDYTKRSSIEDILENLPK